MKKVIISAIIIVSVFMIIADNSEKKAEDKKFPGLDNLRQERQAAVQKVINEVSLEKNINL